HPRSTACHWLRWPYPGEHGAQYSWLVAMTKCWCLSELWATVVVAMRLRRLFPAPAARPDRSRCVGQSWQRSRCNSVVGIESKVERAAFVALQSDCLNHHQVGLTFNLTQQAEALPRR